MGAALSKGAWSQSSTQWSLTVLCRLESPSDLSERSLAITSSGWRSDLSRHGDLYQPVHALANTACVADINTSSLFAAAVVSARRLLAMLSCWSCLGVRGKTGSVSHRG